MSDDQGTLELLGRHLALALRPLRDGVTDRERFRALLYQLGWDPSDLPPAWAALGTAIDEATARLDALGDPPTPEQITDLLTAARSGYHAIQGIATAPPGVDPAVFLTEIEERLFELLLTQYLAAALPSAYNVLQMLNVIQLEHVTASGERPSFVRVHFKWAEIPKIVREPAELPARVYGWGTASLNVDRIVDHLSELLCSLRVPVRIAHPSDELVGAYLDLGPEPSPTTEPSLVVPLGYVEVAGKLREIGLILRALPAANGKLPGLVVEPELPESLPLTFPLTDNVTLRVLAGTNVATTVGILIRPDGIAIKYPFEPGTAPPSAGIGVGLDFTPATPTLLLGAPNETRLEFQGASADFAATSINGEFDASLGAQLKGLALILAPGEGDSFLRTILGGGTTRVDIPLGVEWSRRHGVRFTGSGAFEVSVHPHLQLGPVAVEEVTVRLALPASTPPDLRLELGLGISGHLGPLGFMVEGVGLQADATFADGNVGPFDLQLGFKPPNGMGLSIDAGGFTGGGFLICDSAKGEYAGGLELEYRGFVSVKAIGILNTKLPDGSPGFSLLILITAEFPPIQLGFGFTLLGVGGLLGLNHTVALDVLEAGVRDGSLTSILFPSDIVANAPRIINDLKRAFPPLPDRFLVGPMGKLGWGTPTLIRLEIGVILEIPRPVISVIGLLRMTLPAEEAPLLALQVAFLGVVDFDKGQLSFDASLFDSHLMTFPLSGDMAVRAYWAERQPPPHRGRLPPRLRPAPPRAARAPPREHRPLSGQSEPPGRRVLRAHVEHGAVRRQSRAVGRRQRLQHLRLPRARRADPDRPVPFHRSSGGDARGAHRLTHPLQREAGPDAGGPDSLACDGQGVVRNRLRLHHHHLGALRCHLRRQHPHGAGSHRGAAAAHRGAREPGKLARRPPAGHPPERESS